MLVLFILAYRTGMRLFELLKLRLRDIEKSLSMSIKVRNTREGKNKNSASSRILPTVQLISDNERGLLISFVRQRRLASNGNNELLLASSWNPYQLICRSWASRWFSENLKKCGYNGSFYDTRHTALSNMQLIAEKEWSLVKYFCGYSEKKSKSMHKAVFTKGDIVRDRYWHLSVFAGHASPETTFGSYLHFSSLLVNKRLQRSEMRYSVSFIKTFTEFSKREIGSAYKNAGQVNDVLALSNIPTDLSIMPGVESVSPDDNSDARISRKYPKIINNSDVNEEIVLVILHQLEDGHSTLNTSVLFDIDMDVIEQLKLVAELLVSQKTRAGESRHIANSRTSVSGLILTPGKYQDAICKSDVRKVIDWIEVQAKDPCQLEKLKEVMVYWACNVTVSDTAILFYEPERLNTFLSVLQPVLPAKRWRVDISPNSDSHQETIKKQWQLSLPEILVSPAVKNISKYPFGIVSLYLRHPKEEEIINKGATTLYLAIYNSDNQRSYITAKLQ